MKFKLFRTIGITGAALLAVSALAQNPRLYPPAKAKSSATASETTRSGSADSGTLSAADRSFAKDAAKGGMMEVAMGRVAEQNASNAGVKKFGARMVADHGKANAELKAIARKKGIDLPAEKDGGKWKSDKDYVNTMVSDHEKDLADFRKEAKDGSDPDLKRFADQTAMVIEKHLSLAKDLQGQVK